MKICTHTVYTITHYYSPRILQDYTIIINFTQVKAEYFIPIEQYCI